MALTLAVAIAVNELVPDAPDGARAEAVVEQESGFCRGYLGMSPESQRALLNAKAVEFLFGIHDGLGLDECLPSYVEERAAAVERKCRSRGDFDAGSTLGQILVVGLRECRSRAEAGERPAER